MLKSHVDREKIFIRILRHSFALHYRKWRQIKGSTRNAWSYKVETTQIFIPFKNYQHIFNALDFVLEKEIKYNK